MAFDFKKEYKEFYMQRTDRKSLLFLKQITLRLEEKVIPTKQEGHISKQSVYYMRLRTL